MNRIFGCVFFIGGLLLFACNKEINDFPFDFKDPEILSVILNSGDTSYVELNDKDILDIIKEKFEKDLLENAYPFDKIIKNVILYADSTATYVYEDGEGVFQFVQSLNVQYNSFPIIYLRSKYDRSIVLRIRGTHHSVDEIPFYELIPFHYTDNFENISFDNTFSCEEFYEFDHEYPYFFVEDVGSNYGYVWLQYGLID